MNTNERRYTAREWLTLTLPDKGEWFPSSDHDTIWWFGNTQYKHTPMGVTFNSDGTIHGTAVGPKPNITPIPRSTAIDLMVKGIEAGEVAKQEQPAPAMTPAFEGPIEGFNGSTCRTCLGRGKVPSGVYEQPPEPCPACAPIPAPAFKVGDRVRVVGTMDKEWYRYVEDLDGYIGQEGVVETIDGESARLVFGGGKWGWFFQFRNLQPAPAMGPHDDLAREWVAKHHPEYEVVGYRTPEANDMFISNSGGMATAVWGITDTQIDWKMFDDLKGDSRYILARKAKDEPVEGNGKIIGLADMPGFAEAYSMSPKSASGTSIDRDLFELVKAISTGTGRAHPSHRDAKEILDFARKLLAEMREVRE